MEKTSDQVWWRWFFVSNWGSIRSVARADAKHLIACVLGGFGDDFWRKAEIEIIDGDRVERLTCIELLEFYRPGTNTYADAARAKYVTSPSPVQAEED